jgi:peroxiredoxin Q/BCP
MRALVQLSVAVAAVVSPAAAALRIGEKAPGFSLPGSDGRTHALSDYIGKQAVVLAWFAKAFTGG